MATRSSSRISKRASSRNTRSRSKMSAASSSAGGVALERMVEEATANMVGAEGMDVDFDDDGDVAAKESDGWVVVQDGDVDVEMEMESQSRNAYEGKGKGKLAALPVEEEEEVKVIEDKPFRLFDLPTEIRLEIYRACLTRPYKILLSKPVEPAPKAEEKAEDEDLIEDVSEEEAQAIQAAGAHPSGVWYQQTVQQGRSILPAQLAQRRRGIGRGVARPTLRASSSSAHSQSNASTNAQQTVALSTNAAILNGYATTLSNNNAANKSTIIRRPANPAKRTRTISDNDRRPRMEDPLIVNLLRTTKTVYKEARDVLYSENTFSLDIFTAVTSLAALHQRSRRRIKHVELEIPTYTEILESFSETVRLSLRYCSGLRKLVVHTPFTLPGGDGAGNDGTNSAAAGGNTTVYANGFDILRWLPQGCEVVLEGQRNREIDAVVRRHMRLAGVQDKVGWHARMFVSPDEPDSLGGNESGARKKYRQLVMAM